MSSAPSGAPSSMNCTPATAMLSEADAATTTLPETAPTAGDISVTTGGATSGSVRKTAARFRRPFPMPAPMASVFPSKLSTLAWFTEGSSCTIRAAAPETIGVLNDVPHTPA